MSLKTGNEYQQKEFTSLEIQFFKALKVVKAQQILQRVAILKNDMIFSSMGG